MSDPMTNREIEDVLSSIRRLVSEDVRPLPRQEPRTALPIGLQPVGKLVLTPAFRVPEPVSVPAAAAAAPLPERPSVEVLAADWARDAGDLPLADLALVGVAGDPVVVEATVPADPVALDGVAPAPDSDQANVTAPDAEPVESAAEVSAPALLLTPEMAESFERRSTVPEVSAQGADSDATGPLQPEGDAPPKFTGGSTTHPAFWAAPSLEMARLEETIAELEAAVAASADDFEPEASEILAASAYVLPTFSANAVQSGAALRRLHLESAVQPDEVEDRPATRSAPIEQDLAIGGEEALMDEAALRDLVVEIIRQELQGALGERITRNVRKLVRAEIHRAMAGREFE